MNRFATTFVRALAIFTVTSLVGCDEPSIDDIDDIDDIDELDDDDDELRDAPLDIAAIPFDHYPTKLSFSIPMQPVAQFKPKARLGLHGPTDLAYVWTPSPTGDPDTIMMDLNGVSPYAGNLPIVSESVCDDFQETHPYDVPVTASVSSCAAIEQGCCEYICYQWGGIPSPEYGENKVVAVTDETFKDPELDTDPGMVWGSFVDPFHHMDWTLGATNGGHSSRETVCGCQCEFPD